MSLLLPFLGRSAVLLSGLLLTASAVHSQPADTLWTRTVEYEHEVEAWDIAPTRDGGYVLAGYGHYPVGEGSQFTRVLTKLDSDGEVLWIRVFPGDTDTTYVDAFGVVEAPDGGIVLAGQHGVDASVLKTDSQGGLLWERRFDESHYAYFFDVGLTENGGFIAAGTAYAGPNTRGQAYLVRLDSEGMALWTQSYGVEDSTEVLRGVIQTSDGGFAAAGQAQAGEPYRNKMYVVRTDAEGNLVWQRRYGSDGFDSFNLWERDANGFIVLGYFDIGLDSTYGYLLSVSEAGDDQGGRRFAASGGYNFVRAGVPVEGGLVVAGREFTTHHNLYVTMLDEEGGVVWERLIPVEDEVLVRGLVRGADGALVIVGTRFTSPSQKRMFVAKLRPDIGTAAEEPEGAVTLGLWSAPNPFRTAVRLAYTLEAPSTVRMEIYDVLGRRVRTVEVAARASGGHQAAWDGRSDAGVALPAGVYLVRLEAGRAVATERMVLVR